jgi:hypothetical protein
MSNDPQLHSSIVALISLASGIAAKHPAMGMCQLDKLRQMGIPESQINTAVEIARHIRDEAAQKIDAAFDEKAGLGAVTEASSEGCCGSSEEETKQEESCCSSTSSGQSCC